MSVQVIHALDQLACDLLSGYLPMNVVTLIDAVGYYRNHNDMKTVAGLSELIERNPGKGSYPVMTLFV